jgi:hypothetical protein
MMMFRHIREILCDIFDCTVDGGTETPAPQGKRDSVAALIATLDMQDKASLLEVLGVYVEESTIMGWSDDQFAKVIGDHIDRNT